MKTIEKRDFVAAIFAEYYILSRNSHARASEIAAVSAMIRLLSMF